MGFLSDNFISEFLVNVLRLGFELIRDYSWVILILTLVIKLVLLPLDVKQRKNSRAMTMLQPDIESIKKRFANNPEQQNRKIQELYKERNIKPLAGCLPMLIQLPLLFAFFGALRVIATDQTLAIILDAAQNGADAVVLPQWLWLHNLWQPDSGFTGALPTLQEFTSFVQLNSNYITPQTFAMLQQHGIVEFASGALTINAGVYESLTSGILNATGLTGYANGWFVLPLFAGGSLFLQQRYTAKNQTAGQPQPGGKFMLYFFPLFSVYICCTSNAAFSLYWVFSNLYTFAVNIINDLIYNKKHKAPQVSAS